MTGQTQDAEVSELLDRLNTANAVIRQRDRALSMSEAQRRDAEAEAAEARGELAALRDALRERDNFEASLRVIARMPEPFDIPATDVWKSLTGMARAALNTPPAPSPSDPGGPT